MSCPGRDSLPHICDFGGENTVLEGIAQFLKNHFIRSKRLNATRLVALSFGAMILVGTLLLSTPFATRSGESVGLFTALFTGFSLAPASTIALLRVSPAAWLALLAGVIGSLPVGPWLSDWAAGLKETSRRCVTVLSFAGAAALFVLCLLAAAGSGFQPFIYAQF